MAIIALSTTRSTSYNKVTDTHYVYEVTYFYNEETRAKFKKRRVIGKIDPQTGETIPTGKAGSKETAAGTTEKKDYEALYKEISKKYERQSAFDRNAKEQLTNALRTASRHLDHILVSVKEEKTSIDKLLRLYGTEDR